MRLIAVHLANFLLLAAIGVPLAFENEFFKGSFIAEDLTRRVEINGLIYNVFSAYLQLFLLFLVHKFAQNMQRPDVTDHDLGQDVPFTVFIQNFRVFKKTYKETSSASSNNSF